MGIPVFLASDENYAPFLCTTMFSVLKNTKEFIDFFILENGISETSKEKIEKSLRNFKNKSIEYIDTKSFKLDRFPSLKHYSINTFSRYFIPKIKPDLKKAVYLDSDIIVCGNIKDFFENNLEDKILGAVSEEFYEKNGIFVKENIAPDYKDTKKYFNAGVLLINIEKLAKSGLMDICIEKTIELADKLSCPDQDILNIVFENDTKLLDIKFNYMPDFYKLFQKFYGKKQAKINDKNALILHYTAGKPWISKTRMDNKFWEIANLVEFKEDIKNISKKQGCRLRWYEKFFGIKNFKGHKILYIFGFKLKIKSKN